MATFGNTTKPALDETAHKVDPGGFAYLGDVWQIWDKRYRPQGGLRFKIVQFVTANGDPSPAIFTEIRGSSLYVQVESLASGQRRHIRLERLVPNSKGYRLLERPGQGRGPIAQSST